MKMKYVVVADHPYYPEVYYFDTYEDALNKRNELMDKIFSEDGDYDAKIFIASVDYIINGKCHT